MRRDFAFIVDNAVSADGVLRAARGAERALITGVTLFDLYEGDRMATGKKSLGIEVTFQPRDRTLTDAGDRGRLSESHRGGGEGHRGDATIGSALPLADIAGTTPAHHTDAYA